MPNQFMGNPQNMAYNQMASQQNAADPYSYPSYIRWIQMQQQAQAQAAQQAQAMAVRGRIVASENDITAKDVNMEGYSFFPQNDESCIYVKHWNKSGTIDTRRYIPEPNPQETAAEQQAKFNSDVGKTLQDICNRLDQIEHSIENKAYAATVTTPQQYRRAQHTADQGAITCSNRAE